jgi:hypothetical protein
VVKELTAATYVSVWWPPADVPIYNETHYPEWHDGTYVDPDTRVPLPTWEEALNALDADPEAPQYHVVRFGSQVDVKGVLAGSTQAEECIGYLVKYLVKDLGDDLTPAHRDELGNHAQGRELPEADWPALPDTKASAARRADHISRLVEVLRWEPCSPHCANWLRYGIQPKNPRPNLRPGCCRAKAHKPTHLGYGGRRVLVSRKWTGKDLADHRYDRRAHVLAVLGRTSDGQAADNSATPTEADSATEGPVVWELAKQTDPDVDPLSRRRRRRQSVHRPEGRDDPSEQLAHRLAAGLCRGRHRWPAFPRPPPHGQHPGRRHGCQPARPHDPDGAYLGAGRTDLPARDQRARPGHRGVPGRPSPTPSERSWTRGIGHVAGTTEINGPKATKTPLAGVVLDLGLRGGAGDGNRTRMTSLEGWSSAIELHPRGEPSSR